jgi:hypothetical protein
MHFPTPILSTWANSLKFSFAFALLRMLRQSKSALRSGLVTMWIIIHKSTSEKQKFPSETSKGTKVPTETFYTDSKVGIKMISSADSFEFDRIRQQHDRAASGALA